MGRGSAVIPGGNDGLLLIGMLLLRSYAWTAATSMSVTILVTLLMRSAHTPEQSRGYTNVALRR